ELAEPVQRAERIVDTRGPRARRQLVEPPEMVRGVQVGILDAGERQRALGQIDLEVGGADEVGPGGERRVHQQPGAWGRPAMVNAARWSSSARVSVVRAAAAAAACASGVVASRNSRDRPSSWW